MAMVLENRISLYCMQYRTVLGVNLTVFVIALVWRRTWGIRREEGTRVRIKYLVDSFPKRWR
jgi:hypothetical protein